jgi:phage shock protein A
MTKKTIIVDEFHQGASAQAYRDGVQQMREAVSEIHTKNDGIETATSEAPMLLVVDEFRQATHDPAFDSKLAELRDHFNGSR